MAIEDKSDGRSVQLKNVRLSFTDRIKTKKKTSADSEKETHGCNIIIEKDKPEFEANHKAMIDALKVAGLKAFKNENAHKEIAEDSPKRVCYRKGERFKNKEGKVYTGYEGNFGLTASGPGGGDRRPKLLDRSKRRLVTQLSQEDIANRKPSFPEDQIEDIFYSGCYADVVVSLYGTEKGSRGIFATIEAIRSRQVGDRMGGGIYVDDDDFDDLDEDGDGFDQIEAAPPEDDDLGL